MSNPKGRTVPDTLTMYLIILVLYCLDIFFLQSDRSVLGDALYSRLAGLLILFGYIWVKKDSVSVLGINPNKKKFAAGVIYGTLFSVVPLFIVIVVEAIYLGITDITALDLQFSPPSMKYVRDIENLTPAAAVLIYIFTSLVGSLLKEFTFRGYILKKLKKVTNFKTANIIQALLYMLMTMPMLLRNSVMGYYDQATASLIVFIIFFYIIHETLAGLKWGFLTRVTGATYVAVIDHFLFVFLANSIYITNRYVTWSFMTHMLAVQVISFVFVLIYYKINIKKINEKAKEEKSKKAADEKSVKENEKKEAVDEKLKEINEISPDQYKAIVDQTNASRKSHHHHHSEEYIRQRNEANSAKNETLFENVPTSDAAKAAGLYLSNNLNSSHHHSSGSHSHTHSHPHSSGRMLESFDADKIAAKTGEYSDSLSLERKTPKHPHPHDTIARDSRLSVEELDKANADKVLDFDETDINEFLKNFSNEMSKQSHHHRHRHHTSESVSENESEDINGEFDADKFLKDYQKKEESRYTSSHYSPSSLHSSSEHHHHHSSGHKRDSEVVSITEISTDKFFDEYQKTVEEKKENKKQNFIQRMRELGMLDDSESNDLI